MASLVFFSFVDAQNQAQNILLDASVNETHSSSAQVTEHQVEKGSNISDHVRPMPDTVTIEGLITNAPITDKTLPSDVTMSQERGVVIFTPPPMGGSIDTAHVATFESWRFSKRFNRVQDVFIDLAYALLKGFVFTISTSLIVHKNMICTSLTVPRNIDVGDALRFTANFTHIRFVTTQTVAVTARQAKKDDGHKAPTPASKGEINGLQDALSRTAVGDNPPPP